jgi:histidinol-phosphate aminotransferase
MDYSKLLRRHMRGIQPYSSARDEFSGVAMVYLDANENAYGSAAGNDYHRYPDPRQQALKKRIATIKAVPEENIFIGNGSDEPIDLIIRAFCQPGKDAVITLPPTYGMYGVSAQINEAENIEIPLSEDFQPQVEQIRAAADQHTKILFLCSPNNPTGNIFREDHVLELVRSFPGMVVIDEAYIDFADHSGYRYLLKDYSNLVILQTFSKAWGLAALRLGVAFAHRGLIELLNKIKPPYNISGATQSLVLQGLQHETLVEQRVAKLVEQRKYLASALATSPHVQKVYPSDANFLLVKMDDAKSIYGKLIDEGIIVRDRSGVVLCKECLRITIGTEAENGLLLEALQNI